jgi:hypothetical protein
MTAPRLGVKLTRQPFCQPKFAVFLCHSSISSHSTQFYKSPRRSRSFGLRALSLPLGLPEPMIFLTNTETCHAVAAGISAGVMSVGGKTGSVSPRRPIPRKLSYGWDSFVVSSPYVSGGRAL